MTTGKTRRFGTPRPVYTTEERDKDEAVQASGSTGRDFSTDMAQAQSHTAIANHSNCLSRAKNGQYMCVQQFLRLFFFFHITPLGLGSSRSRRKAYVQ